MTTAELLRRAKSLLEERGWTQGVYARVGDRPCHPWADNPTSFCSAGAVMAASQCVAQDGYSHLAEKAVIALQGAIGGTVAFFNDAPGRTKDEVLAAFDRAIEIAEREASK